MRTQNNRINNGNKYIEYLLVFLFIILLPFENSFLQESFLGLYGASLSVFPLLLLFLYSVLFNKIEKEFFYLLLYSFLTFFVSLIVFYNLGYNEDIILIQPLKNILLYLTWFYAFFYFKNLKRIKFLKIPIKILIYILLAIIFLTIFFTEYVNNMPILSYGDIRNAKFRGFSLESSTFGFLIVSSFLLYILYYGKRIVLYIPFLVFILFILQSKGGLLSLLLTFLICSLILFKKNLLKNIFYIILFLSFYLITVSYIGEWFTSDIESYTSFATRLTLIVFGLCSVFISPIGWGFSGYYPYFYINLDNIVNYIQAISPISLNFSEVLEYSIVGNFKSVGTKSFIFDCMIVYGFPFILILFIYLKNIISYILAINDYNRLFLLIFILLALLFYNSSFGMYIGAFALGLVFNKNLGKIG